MIEVRGLSFSYGHRNAIHDISFSAGDGEVVAILGNNGAGKSTLVKCIDRIRIPCSGDVLIDGVSTGSMSRRALARLISYTAQRSECGGMSVFDSILLGRRPYIRWGAGDEDIGMCASVIRSMGIEDLQFRCLDELSGGEQQKVMLARALVQEPRVMLLDEPTSSLDSGSQYEMMALVRKAAEERGITVLAVLHDLNLALRFCDRFFFMKGGTGYGFCSGSDIDSNLMKDVYGIDAEVVMIGGRRSILID